MKLCAGTRVGTKIDNPNAKKNGEIPYLRPGEEQKSLTHKSRSYANPDAHVERTHNSKSLTMNKKAGHDGDYEEGEGHEGHEDHHHENHKHMSMLKKQLMELEDKEED